VDEKLILIDTSAWIAGFRREGPPGLEAALDEALETNRAVIVPFVALELLQGCKSQNEFRLLKQQLGSLVFDDLEDSDWQASYLLGFSLRRKGITVPTLDLLLAHRAIEKRYRLLHHDRHFRLIEKHAANLDAVDFLP
jgi:predicted nucleic acid-binding protein